MSVFFLTAAKVLKKGKSEEIRVKNLSLIFRSWPLVGKRNRHHPTPNTHHPTPNLILYHCISVSVKTRAVAF
jgi:hypothetical protein